MSLDRREDMIRDMVARAWEMWGQSAQTAADARRLVGACGNAYADALGMGSSAEARRLADEMAGHERAASRILEGKLR